MSKRLLAESSKQRVLNVDILFSYTKRFQRPLTAKGQSVDDIRPTTTRRLWFMFAELFALLLALQLSATVVADARVPRTLGLSMDNDILVPSSRDQDYTAGLNIAYSGADVNLATLFSNHRLARSTVCWVFERVLMRALP